MDDPFAFAAEITKPAPPPTPEPVAAPAAGGAPPPVGGPQPDSDPFAFAANVAPPAPAQTPTSVANAPALPTPAGGSRVAPPVDVTRIDNQITMDEAGVLAALSDPAYFTPEWATPETAKAIYDASVANNIDPAAVLGIAAREGGGRFGGVQTSGRNPGNIRDVEGWYGTTEGTVPGPDYSPSPFARYVDIPTGFAAIANLLGQDRNYVRAGNNTYALMGKKYGPPDDFNSVTWGEEAQTKAEELRSKHQRYDTPQVAPAQATPAQATPAQATPATTAAAPTPDPFAFAAQVGSAPAATTAPTAPTGPQGDPFAGVGQALAQVPGPLAQLPAAIPAVLGGAAQGAQQLGSAVQQVTRDVPLLGGVVNFAGDTLGQLGRAGGEAAPQAAQALLEGGQAKDRLEYDLGRVFRPDETPATDPLAPAGGIPSVPKLAEDLVTTAFRPIMAAGPFIEVGTSVLGKPAAGVFGAGLGAAGALAQGNPQFAADIMGNALADPTAAQKKVESYAERGGLLDIPFAGGVTRFVTSGEFFNPVNFIGTGATGVVRQAVRAIPLVRETAALLNVTDRAISTGIGLPVTLPLKALGGAYKAIPLTKEAKFAQEGADIAQAARGFFARGGSEADLALVARGGRPGVVAAFTPKEFDNFQQYARAYTTALGRTGGAVTSTTEAEFVHALTEGLAKKHGIVADPKGLSKLVSNAQSLVKSGWLGLNPAYVAQNGISNLGVAAAHAVAPLGDNVYQKLQARRGLPTQQAGYQSFGEYALGKKNPLYSVPLLGWGLEKQKNLNNWVERSFRQGAVAKKQIEYYRSEQPKRAAELVAKFASRLSPQERRVVEALFKGHQGTPAELGALIRGEGPAWAALKDFGDAETLFATAFASARGKLAALGNDPRAPGVTQQARRIMDDLKREIEVRGRAIAATTPLSARQVLDLERPMHAQSFAALRGVDNPERLLEMLYAFRHSTTRIAELDAVAKEAMRANPANRRAIYQTRHEEVLDLIHGRNSALDLALAHAYRNNYTPQQVQAAQTIVANLIRDITTELGAVRRATQYGRAGGRIGPAIGATPEEIWAAHHQSLLHMFDVAGSGLAAIVRNPRSLRGPDFWGAMLDDLARTEREARAASRANIDQVVASAVAQIDGWAAQLDTLPAEWSSLQANGMGLLSNPSLQREIANEARRLYGGMGDEGYKRGVEYADKLFFNYAMTNQLDKMLGWASPFVIWQTRNLPLWANMLATKPGLLRGVSEYHEETVDRAEEDTLPARFGGFIRSTELDPLYSALIGRPISAYSNPLAAVLGGYSQTDMPPYVGKDVKPLGQAVTVGGYLGGGLSLWPWLDIPLKVSGQMGRSVSYGDFFAPSRFLRTFGIDFEQNWKRFLLEAQGIETETANPFLDQAIQRRIAEIAAEQNITDEATLYRAMADPKHPLHVRARKEAEAESNTISALRYVFPIGVRTVSPGLKELYEGQDRFGKLKDAGAEGSALSALFDQIPGLGAFFARNASRDRLMLQASLAEYYALGTDKQRELEDAYFKLDREQQRRYAQLHPAEYNQLRTYWALKQQWQEKPESGVAQDYLDSSRAAKQQGKKLSEDEFLAGRGLPTRRQEQDTRDPFQILARAAEQQRGAGMVAKQQEAGKLGAHADRYYALETPQYRAALAQYDQMSPGRERTAFGRNSGIFAVWDAQRDYRNANTAWGRYQQWSRRQREAGKPTGYDEYIDELAAGRVPAFVRESGTAASPSQAA